MTIEDSSQGCMLRLDVFNVCLCVFNVFIMCSSSVHHVCSCVHVHACSCVFMCSMCAFVETVNVTVHWIMRSAIRLQRGV